MPAAKRCATCHRTLPREGCSHTTCPERKVVTAAPKEDAVERIMGDHGYVVRRPKLSDES